MDSSGKLPTGFLEGVLSSVGDYEECLNIASPKTKESKVNFAGQYCWARPVLPHPARNSFRPGDKLDNKLGLPNKLIDELVDVLYLTNGTLFNIGLCIPSTCNATEIELAINTSKCLSLTFIQNRTFTN